MTQQNNINNVKSGLNIQLHVVYNIIWKVNKNRDLKATKMPTNKRFNNNSKIVYIVVKVPEVLLQKSPRSPYYSDCRPEMS